MNEVRPFFFGKLPEQDDFVRQNASGPDFRFLDQWLQEGLFQATRVFSAAWEEVYQNACPYQFCIQAESAGLMLVGVIWPSHDRSGRRFPFVVAARDNREGLVPGLIPYMPLLYKEFLRESGDLAASGLNGLSLRDLTAAFDRLPLPVVTAMDSSYQHFQDYLDGTTSEEFWARQLVNSDASGRMQVIKNLFDALGPLISGNRARGSLGLRFPLGEGNVYCQEDACFWVVLCSEILRDAVLPPNVFWGLPRPGQKAYLYFFPHRPPAKCLIPLLRPDFDSDIVCRLDEENREGTGHPAPRLPPRFRAALESPDITLRSLLGEMTR